MNNVMKSSVIVCFGVGVCCGGVINIVWYSLWTTRRCAGSSSVATTSSKRCASRPPTTTSICDLRQKSEAAADGRHPATSIRSTNAVGSFRLNIATHQHCQSPPRQIHCRISCAPHQGGPSRARGALPVLGQGLKWHSGEKGLPRSQNSRSKVEDQKRVARA